MNVCHYGFKIQSLTRTYHCRSQNLQPADFFSFFSFLFVCVSVYSFFFFKQKIYILIQFRLCGRVSDKKISPGRFPETRLLVFWPWYQECIYWMQFMVDSRKFEMICLFEESHCSPTFLKAPINSTELFQ